MVNVFLVPWESSLSVLELLNVILAVVVENLMMKQVVVPYVQWENFLLMMDIVLNVLREPFPVMKGSVDVPNVGQVQKQTVTLLRVYCVRQAQLPTDSDNVYHVLLEHSHLRKELPNVNLVDVVNNHLPIPRIANTVRKDISLQKAHSVLYVLLGPFPVLKVNANVPNVVLVLKRTKIRLLVYFVALELILQDLVNVFLVPRD